MNQQLNHLADCLKRLERAGPDTFAAELLWSDIPSLMVSRDVARDLVAEVASLEAAQADESPARRLLEALLDEARRSAEDGKPEGRDFLDAAEQHCRSVATKNVTSIGIMCLGQAYSRADLAVPSAIMETQRDQLGGMEGDGDAELQDPSSDIAQHLRSLLAELGDDVAIVYEQLSELISAMPDDGCQRLIREIGSWEGGHHARLCAYWVLDPRAALAQAAAETLQQRASNGRLDGEAAGVLAWLRPFLPEGTTRETIDEALAAYRRRHRTWPELPTHGNAEVAYLSVPDGAGAQYILLNEPRNDGACWSFVLAKLGYGIRDAYVRADLDETEESELLGQLGRVNDVYMVPLATAKTLIAVAASETVARGEAPPPGLLDVAAATDLADLRPRAISGRAWLTTCLDPGDEMSQLTPQKRGRWINQSRNWDDHLTLTSTWFTDNERVRQLLDRSPNEDTMKRRLRAELDEQRAWWAEIFYRSALATLGGSDAGLRNSMAVTATALLEGREIRRIPVMETIIERSIDAWSERFGPPNLHDAAASGGPPPNTGQIVIYPDDHRGVLEAFCQRARANGTWLTDYYGLHGYLFGIATNPELIQPSEWLTLLLGDPESADAAVDNNAQAQELIQAIMEAYNTINECLIEGEPALPDGAQPAEDPKRDGQPEAPIRQWVTGFCIAVETFGDAAERKAASVAEGDAEGDVVERAYLTARMLADPEALAKTAKAEGNDIPTEQVVDSAVRQMPRALLELAAVAQRYRQTDGAGLDQEPVMPTKPTPPRPARSEKVGRNQPCPCGSGKKYKRCCGNRASRG